MVWTLHPSSKKQKERREGKKNPHISNNIKIILISTFPLIPKTFQCYLFLAIKENFYRGYYKLILQILVEVINNEIIVESETETLSTNIKER